MSSGGSSPVQRLSSNKPGGRGGRAVVKLATTNRYARFGLPEGDPDRLTAADLDDDEIMRGQLKADNGTFSGRPPAVIPRAFLEAIMAERPERLQSMLNREVPVAIKALHEVMVGGTSNKGGGAKVSAATKILEYAIGRPTEKVALTVSKEDDEPWRGLMPQVLHIVPNEEKPDAEPARVLDAERGRPAGEPDRDHHGGPGVAGVPRQRPRARLRSRPSTVPAAD